MNSLWVIFPVVVGVMIWIGLTSRSRRRDEAKNAFVRFKQYGVFSVVYECIDQLVAMNSTQDFVLVIDAKVQAKDSSGRVVARFDRSLGFSVAQVKSYLQTADSATPAANDLISFQLQLRGLTIGDDSVSTV